MWKQFIRRFQKKSSKSDPMPDPSCSGSSSSENPAQTNRTATASVKKMSSAIFPSSLVAGIEPLLSFKDVPNSEKQNLFIAKLNLCCVVFDFNDPAKHSAEKDLKRQVLIDLVDFVAAATTKFSEPAIAACCNMISTNLFRVFPPNYRSSSSSGSGENDDDEPVFDPAWPHLQLVHELLLNFIISSSVEAKILKKYVDHSFLLGLLDLFDSDDPRERDCLKTTLHRIYGKFMVHRPFIRKAVSNIFCRFVSETEKHNGIAELLEVFGSIISGFALPLKEEHKLFLWRVLVPLHKPKTVGVYIQQLTFCVTQFIEKDPKLASTVIRGLLRYWPVTSSQKEVMFLSEVEEILESTSVGEFQEIMIPLFQRIGCCLSSTHFQVAERALHLWNNDRIMSLITPNREVIVPCILPYLEKNAQTHWNQAVQNVTQNVRKMLAEMDGELFTACQSKIQEDEKRRAAAGEIRRCTWERLETAAAAAISPPTAGYVPVLIGHLR